MKKKANISKRAVMGLKRGPLLTYGLAVLLAGVAMSCNKENDTLAPYTPGPVHLNALQVESGTYTPAVSWGGGYVSALGVNRGTKARLDTSLVWLIHQAGDAIHYQQHFGVPPSGSQDLTTTYGGQPLTSLAEDQMYTFWVAKDDVWGAITSNAGKTLVADTSATVPTRVSGDTLYLRTQSFTVKGNPIDLFINIRNVNSVGRLGIISVIPTNTTNAPIITFKVNQTGTPPPDTLLANIGISAGGTYDVSSVVWEVLSVDSSSGTPVYWTKDVITSPVTAGQSIPGTAVFTAFPPEGLKRNQGYYVWIANKNWDQKNRTRTAYNYAYATFETY